MIQSGKPIGVFPTHAGAPRVLIANSNLVGRWATTEHFYQLQGKGKIAWGGLTAGCWQYIGFQGVLQGTFETFAAASKVSLRTGRPAGPLRVHGGAGRHGQRAAAGHLDAGGRDAGAGSEPRTRPGTAAARAGTGMVTDDLGEAIRLCLDAKASGAKPSA